jgi:hypothetical protein
MPDGFCISSPLGWSLVERGKSHLLLCPYCANPKPADAV